MIHHDDHQRHLHRDRDVIMRAKTIRIACVERFAHTPPWGALILLIIVHAIIIKVITIVIVM